uniref:Evasin n=1 Tax=Rhipicephalus pulchellus TaxID=72859 RepID=L7MA88_RHIPC
MVQVFPWAAFLLIIACYLGHGSGTSSTNCDPFNMQTPAGLKVVGCAPICQKRTDPVKASRSKMECLIVSPEARNHIVVDVNYTCELGICDGDNNCNSSDLFIGCWKPLPITQKRGWLPVPPHACWKM